MLLERDVEKIASEITQDPEKQKWLKYALRELSGATWIIPDETLRVARHGALRGMLRRKRNSCEHVLNCLRQAAGIKTRLDDIDIDPLG